MATAILTVDQVFSEALLRAAGNERAGYLDIACASNPELRQRVEQLLLAYGDAESFLESPATGVDATLEHTITEQPGTQIGPYKLLQEIGQGGMGVVYMAEQSQPVQRKIALKIIKVGMDTAQVVARFQAERQALALMNHPNIAKVFDAGSTESGRPYFVMELVRGIPITEFCDAQKLNLRERMELFVTVCEAVHHAHQKGIIHRDLKPSNLLVELHDVKAVPKVIDFGIAKSTNQKLTERTLFTNYSQMIGTPRYMSPEQSRLSGLDIDIRTDIYSLGVLLYELLTGTTPLTTESLSQVGYDELRRKIQEEEPPRASARISTLKAEVLTTLATNQRADAHRIRQHLRGELDWIVAKALEKDRTRRYQSAREFADDINRFLNGEPVEAHPPSVAYRLTKIVRRHRTAFALAAVLLLVLISATGISVRYAMVANSASRAADAGRQDAIDQRNIADKERGEAETQRNEAQRLQAEAVQQRETVRKNLYTADMRLAAVDIKNENIARLHTQLQTHVPQLGAADFRSWEWYYLQGSGRMNERSFHGHSNQVEEVAWSPDGNSIGSVSLEEQRAIIWNAATGKIEKRFKGGTTLKRAAAWSPDSTQFAWGSCHSESAIRIWNSATDEQHILRGHTYSLLRLAWSPDGRRLASSAKDSTCRIWDVVTKECITTLNCETGDVNGVAWHPQGNYVATAGRELRIWNPVDGTQMQQLDHMEGCHSLAFTADGVQLIAVDSKGQCSVMDTNTWTIAANFTAHRGACKSVAVFGNTKFATSGDDGMLRVWSLPECKNLETLRGHEAAVNAVCWDPSGNYLASAGSDKKVNIWNMAHRSIFRLVTVAPSHATDVMQLKNSALMGVILESQDRKVLDLTTDTLRDDGIEKSVFDLQFVAPETDLEALVRQVHLELNDQGGDLLPEFIQSVIPTSETTQKISVVWSPDRTRVACNNGGDIRVWNIVKQQQIFAFTVVSGEGQLKWAPDSRKLGLGGPGVPSANSTPGMLGWAYIFDTDKRNTVHRMLHGDLKQSMTAIEWDPRGERIATAGSFGNVVCWAAESGKRISNGQIFRTAITSMAWSPDTSRLAVAGSGGLVKIIDPVSCEELLELSEAKSTLKKLMWSSDGQRLIGVDSQGNIAIWDASKGYEYAQSEDSSNQLISARNALQMKLNDASSDPSRLRLIDQFLRIYPNDIMALDKRALVFWANEDYQQAVIEYERMTQLFPGDSQLWKNNAMALSRLGRHQETVNALSHALEIDPANDNYLLNRVAAYLKLGDSASARKDVLAVANRRSDESGKCLLAIFELKNKNQASYKEICTEMLTQKSDDGIEDGEEFLWTLAIGLNAVPSYQRPIASARKLLETDKKQPSYQLTLGAILFRANEHVSEEAVPLLTSSVTMGENGYDSPIEGYCFLAMCHHQLGNKSEAQQWLDKANAVDNRKTIRTSEVLWTQQLLRDQANELISGAN